MTSLDRWRAASRTMFWSSRFFLLSATGFLSSANSTMLIVMVAMTVITNATVQMYWRRST